MSCMNDFRDFVIGADPMQVEHHWQSMYVQSFYRAGPVIGSAISGIDQAIWDIRGKILGLPVYQILGGPFDARGVRGYYHVDGQGREQLEKLRPLAVQIGVSCFKTGIPGYYEWIESNNRSIDRAVKSMQMVREALAPDIDVAVDFHAKTSPDGSIGHRQGSGAPESAVHRGAVPSGERTGRWRASRGAQPRRSPRARDWIASYGTRELIEMGVVDILQTDINHVGGVTGLWKVAACADASGISMSYRMLAKARLEASRRSTSTRRCRTSSSRRSAVSSNWGRRKKSGRNGWDFRSHAHGEWIVSACSKAGDWDLN